MIKVHLNKHLARNNQDLLKQARNNLSHDYACTPLLGGDTNEVVVINTIGKTKQEFLNKKTKIGKREWIDPKQKWLKKGILKLAIRDLNVPLDNEDIFMYDFTKNEYVWVDFRCFDINGEYDDELTELLHGDLEKAIREVPL